MNRVLLRPSIIINITLIRFQFDQSAYAKAMAVA